MTCSPTSSEEEMALSLSEGSGADDSGSSREGSRVPGATTVVSSRGDISRDTENSLVICVVIPDLQQSIVLNFESTATIWSAKQQVLCTLTQPLRDVLNYGLFQPAFQGRESGFLDEEQPLRQFSIPKCQGVPTLEFRYKSRVYKHTNVNEMLIAKINIQTNLRRFIECVQQLETDKVEKMLDRGLDPNYHDPENGETPLTLAVQLGGASSIITALKNGGAHMDFRSQDGLTALHKAVKANNHAALKTLLDLGSSVNYKDSQSLTPLYHSVLVGGELACCLLLLRYSATLGCSDENGWTEMHQACRYGHLQHLEQLLLFGADISSQNATGNTGLHISALHKQEPCVRLLLSIGACKDVKNYRGQTPFQVAITAGNFELADIIKNYKDNDNVHVRDSPRCPSPFRVNHASPSRHWVPSTKQQLETAPVLLLRRDSDHDHDHDRPPDPGAKKSRSSTVVSTPAASPSFTARRSPSPGLRSASPTMPSPAVSTVKTVGGVRGGRPSSRSRSPSLGRPAATEEARRQHQRHTSPHSGAGRPGPDQAHHRTREEADQQRNNNLYSAVTGRQFVAIAPYHPQADGEIALCKNDRVKVLCVGEGGYLKGSVRGNVGWFPAECVEEVPTPPQEERPYTRADHAERRKLFRNYTVGSYDSFDASSNRIIDEKTVVLQKRDNEGFGFVLRGAKADTPIEEFSPTPAFPALQYLESVDEGGVAWLAGLRTGDFLIKVNQDNVVKVGHKQVVNMIRHGGNRLIIKVVTVSRTLDPENSNRKKVLPTPRRGPSTMLSMAMRSKSMTSELEELATLKRKKDDDHAEKPMWDSNRNNAPNAESRKPLPPKTRSSSRYAPFNPEANSIGDIQEVPVQSRAGPGNARAAYLGIPKQGIIRRQKSIGVTEEEKQFLSPPMLKLARSLSMPDTSEDIPPPPAVSPPSPPSPSPYATSHPQAPPEPEERVMYGGAVYPRFPQNGAAPGKGCPAAAEPAEDGEGAAWKRNAGGTAQQSFLSRCTPAQIPENPYSDRAKLISTLGSFNVSKQARKGMLMKQPKVEDSPEKGTSIPIPTIIIKEPSTSSSGKSSQASSMEVEPGSQDLPGQLRPDANPSASSVFLPPAIRSRRLVDLRNSVSFRSTDLADEDPAHAPPPRLRQSRSIDEGMLSSDEHFRRLVVSPLSLLNIPDANNGGGGGGGGGAHLVDCGAPETSMVRAPLNTRTGLHHPQQQQHHHHLSPLSLPVKSYTPSLSSLSSPAPPPSMGYGHYLHPVTGKPLDPSSPLALALAARDQAIRGQNQPLPLKTEAPKSDLNKPLFIDTKLARPSAEATFGSATVTPLVRAGPRGALRRQMTESKYETDTKYEHPLAKEKKRAEQMLREDDPSQHKRAGLLMVHTSERARRGSAGGLLGDAKQPAPKDHSQPASAPAAASHPSHIHISPHKTFITVTSPEEPVKLPYGMIPPPPLASVDIPEDELFPESLPPPIEFANSFDISESQANSIAELLKQTNNLSSDQAQAITEILKQTQNAPPGSASAGRQSSVSPFYPSYFLPTGGQHEVKSPGLTNTMLPIYPEVSLDSFGPVGDSGIEVEVDGRSGGDAQLEAGGTASNVSSMSTLSSEGGGEGLDSCSVYADGQAFTAAAMINKSNRSAKVKTHSVVLHHRSGKEAGLEGMMAPRDESSYNGGGPPSYVPALPGPGDPPRTTRDGGEGKLSHMPKAGDSRRCAGARNAEFSSGVPRRNTVTFASTTVLSSLSCQEVITNSGALSGSSQRSPSPTLSPPPDAGLRLPPSAASPSPALADLYVLPPLGSGISRSSSPLASSPSASSSKPFASKPLILWSKDDVADWLDNLNLSEHKDAFLDNDIEGSHLPSLQKDDLVDLGVTRVGHRMNIERALKDLMDM